METLVQRYEGKGHGQLKNDVAEALEELLNGPRTEFNRLQGEPDYLAAVAREGAEKAKERSSRTIQAIRKLIGLF